MQAGVIQVEADISHQEAGIAQTQAALESARSRKAQAEADLSQAKAKVLQAAQQILVQKAALNQAEAQFALSSANVKRYAGLLQQGFVAQEDYDQAEATFQTNSASIDSAKASIEAAQADKRAAEEVVHSNEALVKAAASDELSAIANVRAARAMLASSQANLAAAKSSVNASRATVQANVAAVGSSVANENRYQVLRSFDHVVAPFDGIITARNVDVGSLLSPGGSSGTDASNATPTTGLFGIARVDTLRIYVNVPQSDYQWARNGTEVKVSIRELPDQKFTGVVHESAGALDTATRTLLTEIRLPNRNGLLLPGMYATATFSGADEKKIRVPSNTLIVDAKGTRVAVVDADNKIHFKQVVLGRDYGTEAEVVSGVSATDRLVSNPTDDLQEGHAVQVLPTPESPKS
jgi:RND family efflux transporter MFP subunit